MILIIDDEQGIRTVLTDVLEDEGYAVSSAERGDIGLKMIDKGGIDLVILDVWLPDCSGIDILSTIKNSNNDLPVVVISGHANIDMAVKALALGAYDFLEKPLSIDKIITVVANALEMNQLKLENRNLKKVLEENTSLAGVASSLHGAMKEFEKQYISKIFIEKKQDKAATASALELNLSELDAKLIEFRIS